MKRHISGKKPIKFWNKHIRPVKKENGRLLTRRLSLCKNMPFCLDYAIFIGFFAIFQAILSHTASVLNVFRKGTQFVYAIV